MRGSVDTPTPLRRSLVSHVVSRVVRAAFFREDQMSSRKETLMLSLTHLGVTPWELNDLVEGEVWARWLEAEPALATVGCLPELHALRGLVADGPLGALVRLAARDGGDDELAGIAVVHQLEGGVRRLVRRLGDQSDDIEAVVIGALWEKIRTFPWRRRTRAYAANLILDTKTAVMVQLQPGRTRHGREALVFVDATTSSFDAIVGRGRCVGVADQSGDLASAELFALLEWAWATHVISGDDVRLLRELVDAGHEVAEQDTPRTLRGVCSEAAVMRVAERRGVCAKTIVRHRNRAVVALRAGVPRYLVEAA
jgi:hypothetical protein